MNSIIISVVVLLVLTLIRLNIISAIIASAFIGGLLADLNYMQIWNSFLAGLGHNAQLALSYSIVGGFAYLLSLSGFPEFMVAKITVKINSNTAKVKFTIISLITVAAIFSQNLIPIHVAFIPLLIPPLLIVFDQLQLDRRLVSCLLSFGLVTPYMLLPIGFGELFLNQLIKPQIYLQGLVAVNKINIMNVMIIPALGMLLGLLVAIFFSYKKPRSYQKRAIQDKPVEATVSKFTPTQIIYLSASILIFILVQLISGSMALGALVGCFFLSLKDWHNNNSRFSEGTKLMASIGIVMMAASGFAQVMHDTGHIQPLVESAGNIFAGYPIVAIASMLAVGLLITIGIGSSFATIPLLVPIYVPLGTSIGLSIEAITCLIVVAGVLGDTGSPVSEVTLATTAGLNNDSRHDHIRDTVIPTFLHFNIPLICCGIFAVMKL